MRLKDLLENRSGHFCSVSKADTVAYALAQMSGYGASALVVMDKETPCGIFTEQDLVRCHILFPDRSVDGILLKEVMSPRLIAGDPGDTVEDAMAMMIRVKIRHLPVMKEKKVLCLMGLEDLVKAHVGALTREIHHLKDYISDLQDAAHD